MYDLILATDLDGTFLEGDHQIKRYFYNELLRLRDRVLLVYVTGRPVETVKQFCEHGYLPAAHFIIGDLGAHVVDGYTYQPVDPLQKHIITQWNNGNHVLKNMLANDIGIQLQPIDPPYRVAYYYDQDLLQDETLKKIDAAGFDVILSCDMYLDILPRGVNKGSTLVNLLNFLGLDSKHAITCGDSLNDLSLFQTGLNSIVVGNAEPKLVTEIQTLSNVYHSMHPGLAGIIDGLSFFDKTSIFSQNAA